MVQQRFKPFLIFWGDPRLVEKTGDFQFDICLLDLRFGQAPAFPTDVDPVSPARERLIGF